MSTTKYLAYIPVIVIVLLGIGFLRMSMISSAAPDYAFNYMLGYSIPIVSGGVLVSLAFLFVMRKPKKVVRKMKVIKLQPINHQNPVFEKPLL